MNAAREPVCFVVTRPFAWLVGNILQNLDAPLDHEIYQADVAEDRDAFQKRLQHESLGAVIFLTHHPFRTVNAEVVIRLAQNRGAPVLLWNVDSAPMIHSLLPEAVHQIPIVHVSRLDYDSWTRCLMPGSRGSWTQGIGPHPMAAAIGADARPVADRSIDCLLPINLKWCGITLEEIDRRIQHVLKPPLCGIVEEAVEEGFAELRSHPAFSLDRRFKELGISNAQVLRVLTHFAVAKIQLLRRHALVRACLQQPVHINVDEVPPDLLATPGIRAELSRTGSQENSLRLMADSKSVISISFVNDLPHDRFFNALRTGSLPVVESSAAYPPRGPLGDSLVFYDFAAGTLDRVLEEVCRDKLDLEERSRRIAEEVRAKPIEMRFSEFERLIKAEQKAS